MTKTFMVYIGSTKFGSVTINNKKYGQVLIIGGQIEERDEKQLYKLFGTTHQIGEWEVGKLLSTKPEVIIIGNGQSGVLKVNDKIKQKFLGLGIELKILLTKEAIKEFNKINQTGRKVNALIHTTC